MLFQFFAVIVGLANSQGPGRCRELNHANASWYLSDSMVPTCGQKNMGMFWVSTVGFPYILNIRQDSHDDLHDLRRDMHAATAFKGTQC